MRKLVYSAVVIAIFAPLFWCARAFDAGRAQSRIEECTRALQELEMRYLRALATLAPGDGRVRAIAEQYRNALTKVERNEAFESGRVLAAEITNRLDLGNPLTRRGLDELSGSLTRRDSAQNHCSGRL